MQKKHEIHFYLSLFIYFAAISACLFGSVRVAFAFTAILTTYIDSRFKIRSLQCSMNADPTNIRGTQND